MMFVSFLFSFSGDLSFSRDLIRVYFLIMFCFVLVFQVSASLAAWYDRGRI